MSLPFHKELYDFDRAMVWSGFRQLAPLSVFVSIFGAAFGLAATQTGLGDITIVVMSTLVFAGAAQFAALDLWGEHIPLFTLMITVFAINARHLLMGATLYPWLSRLPTAKRYGIMLVASDANWAMAMQTFSRGKPGFGILLGGGLALWSFWVLGTWLGVYFGNALSDPKSLGLDVVLGCFLLTMVVSDKKNLKIMAIWLTAALTSILAYWYLPENSHVIIGTLAGGIVGTIWGVHDDDH